MRTLLAAGSQPKAPDLIKPAANGLFHSLLAFWPLWLLLVAVAVGKIVWQLYRLRRLARSGIGEIDAMDGRTFEVYLSTLFRRLGYAVEVTKYRGDYGADLVVKKDGRKTVVQAKRWTKRVGLKAVQEAVAAKALYGCEHALVVANREFTQQARRLARANKVELWDREVLIEKLLFARDHAPTEEAPPQTTLDATPVSPPSPSTATAPAMSASQAAPPSVDTEHCATCGDAVSVKVRDYCLQRPALFAGRVYCFNHQRKAGPAVAD